MERELATGGDRQELAARIRELTGRIEREIGRWIVAYDGDVAAALMAMVADRRANPKRYRCQRLRLLLVQRRA